MTLNHIWLSCLFIFYDIQLQNMKQSVIALITTLISYNIMRVDYVRNTLWVRLRLVGMRESVQINLTGIKTEKEDAKNNKEFLDHTLNKILQTWKKASWQSEVSIIILFLNHLITIIHLCILLEYVKHKAPLISVCTFSYESLLEYLEYFKCIIEAKVFFAC